MDDPIEGDLVPNQRFRNRAAFGNLLKRVNQAFLRAADFTYRRRE